VDGSRIEADRGSDVSFGKIPQVTGVSRRAFVRGPVQ